MNCSTKVSNIVLAGRLQSLCLTKVRVEAQERSMEKFNKLMKFILGGCKNLKRFIVDFSISGHLVTSTWISEEISN